MTAREYAEWSRSKEGLRAQLNDIGFYEPEGTKHILSLYRLLWQDQKVQWMLARGDAKHEVAEILKDSPEILNDPLRLTLAHETYAERLMTERGFLPPHWEGIVECEACGLMPGPRGETRLLTCPWCPTIYGSTVRVMRGYSHGAPRESIDPGLCDLEDLEALDVVAMERVADLVFLFFCHRMGLRSA